MADQRVELPAYSMFSSTPVYNVQGNIVFGLLADVVVPDGTDELYTVPSAGEARLDLISDNFYSTPHLWWVLARVNRITDPMTEPATNDVIRIPSRARLAALGVLNV